MRVLWTEQETAFLVECTNAGITSPHVSRLLNRTRVAICDRRRYLRLRLPQKPKPPQEPITPRAAAPVSDIQEIVAEHFGIDAVDMRSRSRKRPVARPRQVGMFLAREMTGKSYPDIARLFGKRNHTTVLYAVKIVRERMASDTELSSEITLLRQRIGVQLVDKSALILADPDVVGA